MSGCLNLAFPPQGLSLKWVVKVFVIESFRASFGVSMFLAIGGTLTALLLGVPAAYGLTRYRVPGGETVRMVLSCPIIVPGIIVGLALLRYLVIPTGVTIMLALFLAHSALVLPYAVRVVSASMENLRTDIEEAAMLLGCTRSGAFRISGAVCSPPSFSASSPASTRCRSPCFSPVLACARFPST